MEAVFYVDVLIKRKLLHYYYTILLTKTKNIYDETITFRSDGTLHGRQ